MAGVAARACRLLGREQGSTSVPVGGAGSIPVGGSVPEGEESSHLVRVSTGGYLLRGG
jgi:hypothetical protein